MQIGHSVKVAVLHESPFRIIDLTEAVKDILPGTLMTVCCDLTKLHEKILRGTPETVLQALKDDEKTKKGEYCIVLDLHWVALKEPETKNKQQSVESKLIEEMKQGKALREAQDTLIERGEKKNAVKQAALTLKKMFK